MDDLEIVAVFDADLAHGRPRYDLQIAFDRDLCGVDPQLVQHLRDADAAGDAAMLAVHANSEASVKAHAPPQ